MSKENKSVKHLEFDPENRCVTVEYLDKCFTIYVELYGKAPVTPFLGKPVSRSEIALPGEYLT